MIEFKPISQQSLLDNLSIYSFFYLENKYHEEYHQFIKEHYSQIEVKAVNNNDIRLNFIDYSMPSLQNIVEYNYPDAILSDTNTQAMSVRFTKSLNIPELSDTNLPPALLAYHNNIWQYAILHKPEDILQIISKINFEGPDFLKEISVDEPSCRADDNFHKKAYELTKEIQQNIDLLKLYGYDEVLKEILNISTPKLSRMTITQDYRIILNDYHNMEIKMTPLVKSLYLMFLNHPEGIYFKDLYDERYHKELMFIYNRITTRHDLDKLHASVQQLLDPYNNSINEKCSRIREAFVSKFNDKLAEYYYITGERGEKKSVKLDRKLITWELPLCNIVVKQIKIF